MRSWSRSLVSSIALLAALGTPVPGDAQTPSASPTSAPERKPLTVAIQVGEGTQLDRELLRAQLERELGVVVVIAELPAEVTDQALRVDAPSLQAVRVSFGQSERTVDLSTTGPHAVETLALVAANLMRDEASDLLATLRATEPAPVSVQPAPAPAPTPVKPEKPERRGCDPNKLTNVPFVANLVPHVGTSSFQGTDVEQSVALNLIGGSADALRGFELAGVFNRETYAVCGAQIAGGANLVSGPMEGFQLAVLNMNDGRVDGAQAAFINTSSGSLHGFQAGFVNLALRGGDAVQAGFANVVTDYLVGAQFGFANVATGTVEGIQLGFTNISASSLGGGQGGFVNIANGTVRGGQFGFVNVARAEGDGSARRTGVGADGLQIGFVNTASGDSHGLQLGFANVTSKQSHGLMLGALNVSENADAAIGLLNIYLKGRTQLDVWVTDAGIVMVGVEHGGRLLHNILGIGASSRSGHGVFAFAYGLGARVHESASLYLDVDVIGYGLVLGEDASDNPDFGSILQLRVPIGFRLSPSVSLFASPALNISVARNKDDNGLRDPSFYGARVTSAGSDVASSIWPGVTLGARFF